MDPTISTLPGFLADDSFILQDTTNMSKEEEGSLVGLSKDPVLHVQSSSADLVLPQEHLTERIGNVYYPNFKKSHYQLTGHDNASLNHLRKITSDIRGNEKAVSQYKGIVSNNVGRCNRPSTHFSRKAQSTFRNKVCAIDTQKVLFKPYFITLTSTPYVYELRDSKDPSAVSEFIKQGLRRFKGRLSRHHLYQHLTGLYKWEHTASELPHLHWLAWFCRWEGNTNTPENELLDYNWIAENWFECLFNTRELREQNIDHLKAGTQTQPLRGRKKKRVEQGLVPIIEQPLSKEELKDQLEDVKKLSLEELNNDIQVGGNYISKYIGKSEEDIPYGFTGRHWGVINEHGYNSCTTTVQIRLKQKDGEPVHSTMVKLDNERRKNLVRFSKKDLCLIKREEVLIPLLPEESPHKYLNEKIELINSNDGSIQIANVERNFLHKWERVTNEYEETIRPSHNIVVLNDHLDANGNPIPCIMEFKDHVYDANDNYIGVYEKITLTQKALSKNSLSGYDGTDLSDLIRRINYVNANGVNEDDEFIDSKFVLHKNGKIISIHDEWSDLGGIRLGNIDEYRYKSSRSFRGINWVDLLKLTFPDHKFIGNYQVHNEELGKHKYNKESYELCINIVPRQEMIVCLE